MKLRLKEAKDLKAGDLLFRNHQKTLVQLRMVEVVNHADGSGYVEFIYHKIGSPWFYPSEESISVVQRNQECLVYDVESRQNVTLSELEIGDVIHRMPETSAIVETLAGQYASTAAIRACSAKGALFRLHDNCHVEKIIKFNSPPEGLIKVKDVKPGDRIAFSQCELFGNATHARVGTVAETASVSIFEGEVIVKFTDRNEHFYTTEDTYVELLVPPPAQAPVKTKPEPLKGHLHTEMWFE